MYKIRQVAEILNVPTVQIHEKLIFLKNDLKGCIHKKNSITFIDEKGLVMIKKAFESEMIVKVSEPESDELETQSVSMTDDESHKLTEIENTYDLKVIELREKIGHSKSQLNKLDIEIMRLNDAILHYHETLKEDIDIRLLKEEKWEQLPVEAPVNERPESETEIVTETEGKKGFFNSFRSK